MVSEKYCIQVCRNSSQDNKQEWEELKSVVKVLQHQPKRLIAEVLRLEPDANYDSVQASAGSVSAETNEEDRRLWIAPTDYDQLIDQRGSCRRAFCRLVLDEMHRRGMDVDLIVG